MPCKQNNANKRLHIYSDMYMKIHIYNGVLYDTPAHTYCVSKTFSDDAMMIKIKLKWKLNTCHAKSGKHLLSILCVYLLDFFSSFFSFFLCARRKIKVCCCSFVKSFQLPFKLVQREEMRREWKRMYTQQYVYWLGSTWVPLAIWNQFCIEKKARLLFPFVQFDDLNGWQLSTKIDPMVLDFFFDFIVDKNLITSHRKPLNSSVSCRPLRWKFNY